MKSLVCFWALVLSVSLLPASEMPWIGVLFQKATSEMKKDTPLPEGVGFEVSRVIPESPLAVADGRKGDLWWKFDGQILINKSQMVVLLRSKSAGEQARIDFYRDGELKNLTVTLKQRPNRKKGELSEAHLISATDGDPSASRRLTKREKAARVSIDGVDYVLRESVEGRQLEVSKGFKVIYSRDLEKGKFTEGVPTQYLDTLHLLHLTLEGMKSGVSTGAARNQRPVKSN